MKEKRVRQVCLDESDSENLENLAPNSKRQAFKSSKLKEHVDSMQSYRFMENHTDSIKILLVSFKSYWFHNKNMKVIIKSFGF